MFRVVTKHVYYPEGKRRVAVMRGPWHPDIRTAQHWVDFLQRTDMYDSVELEGRSQPNATGNGLSRVD